MNVIVIEDADPENIIKHYTRIIELGHELQIHYILDEIIINNQDIRNFALEQLVQGGFRKEQIEIATPKIQNGLYYELDRNKITDPKNNLYLIDGLQGKWNEIIDKYNIPKEKVCLISESPDRRNRAKSIGIYTIDKQRALIVETLRIFERKR